MQNNEDVDHQYVKMYCTTNKFPGLSFCGADNKPNGARGLGNHYHMSFHIKLGHVTCSIRCIPCECTQCIYTLDNPWGPGVPPHQQPRYRPFKYCIYWSVLSSFNNWNIIQFSHKAKYSEDDGKINQFVLGGISDNMAALVKN